ncbi:HD domain-containing phosphohydrolase [Acidihalobacter ferrooxydans]|uniref:HD domain-containing phosphohydrolase n=1 Tax=Acidihalobacter ferrooxydans TaxID=1765967 RepID=UPI0009F8686F|nr:HD domain-containing phosphohydrolase [Acidihalobacter ferrooxydans]
MRTPRQKLQQRFSRTPFLVSKTAAGGRADTEPDTALVIILDDQRVGRAVLSEIIRGLDPTIRIEASGDPQEALSLASHTPPDLIVTDYKMPEMDGLEFTRRLRNLNNCEETPLLMVSIVDDRELLYRALEAGASDFLYRPIDRHECMARARNLMALGRQQRLARQRARWLEERVAEETRALLERERDLIARLARIAECRMGLDNTHYWRVARYARLIAEALGLPASECAQIELAAQLHDIGMAALPDRLVAHARSLSGDDAELLYAHTDIGYDLLQNTPSPLLRLAAQIARYHHAHWDGSGHPPGLAGEDIPHAARIVAVADYYDALIRGPQHQGGQ